MDRGAWWAAVYGVTQSWTWLKWLSMHACIGEGNGNPLQYSCLENPRDRGAWWTAIYGVSQSQTGLKGLSSSSSSSLLIRERKCLKTQRMALGPSPTTCIFEITLAQGELSWAIKWLTWILKKGWFPITYKLINIALENICMSKTHWFVKLVLSFRQNWLEDRV